MKVRVPLSDWLIDRGLGANDAEEIQEAYTDNGILGVATLVRTWNTAQHDYVDEMTELVRKWEVFRVNVEIAMIDG